MTDGNNGNDAPDMAARLTGELNALLRQRDQYALALDAATDPKISVRLQRTLERLEEEIEGLGEAVEALPEGSKGGGGAAAPAAPRHPPPEPRREPVLEPAPASPAVVQDAGAAEPPAPEPTRKEEPPQPSPNGPIAAPDWEEEPATSIYDPSTMLLTEDEPTLDARKSVADAAADSVGSAEESRKSEAAAANAAALNRLRKADPLGPVMVDALEPPTGEMLPVQAEKPRDVAPAPVAPTPAKTPAPVTPVPAQTPAAAAVDGEPDDPFALPGQGTERPADPGASFGSPVAGFSVAPISVLDDEGSGEWSATSKFLLALVIAGFLGGVFYILAI